MKLNTTEEIIEDIAQGKMVVLMDDEDRENEGDLVMAASLVKPEDINFMARHGRGLICLTLTQSRCKQLNLPLMVGSSNNDKHGTNFTISIEASKGVTTGISAGDRAVTVQAAVAKDAVAEDIVMPGHIFPLMAQSGGVLTRAGHTEAGCDITRLAGLEPAAVIVEILNEDGTMARRPDLEKFAQEHDLKLGTVADLIEYRIRNEKTVERVAETNLPTEFGGFHLFAYQDSVASLTHLALVKGKISDENPVLVRVHMYDELCDLFSSTHADCGWELKSAMKYMQSEENGIIVILRKGSDEQELIRRIHNFQLAETGHKRKAETAHVPGEELRDFGVGAQILADLGVHKMRVLGTPLKLHALSGFGLEVEEYVPYE